MHNVYSEWGRITHGVPQGLVTGRYFSVSISMTSLPAFRTARFTFTDATSIQCSSSSVVELEHSLQKGLNEWMNANKLKVNTAKTFLMLIGTRQRVHAQRVNLIVDDRLIEQVSTTKYLGVEIDYIVSKACSKLFAIRRIRPLPKNVTETLYKSLVRPLLDYCDLAWSSAAQKLVNKLKRVQKLAARIILGVPMATRTADLYTRH